MLGRDAVGLAHHFGLVVADDDFAEIGPRLAGDIGGRQDRQQPLDLGHGVARELLGIGEQDRGRGRAVLGLAEQVGRAHFGVDGVVGDDQRLGRPGEQIDADAPEQLPLGFRDVGVARPDDHVHRAIVSVPSAMAATACTPPSTKISSAPPKCIAATIAGCGPP